MKKNVAQNHQKVPFRCPWPKLCLVLSAAKPCDILEKACSAVIRMAGLGEKFWYTFGGDFMLRALISEELYSYMHHRCLQQSWSLRLLLGALLFIIIYVRQSQQTEVFLLGALNGPRSAKTYLRCFAKFFQEIIFKLTH